MAMRPPVGAPTLNRRTRILLIAAGVLVLLLLGGSRLITFYVDWLWFGEVGYRSVFTTIIFTRILQFLLGAVLIGGAVALSLWIAYRFRPVFVPVSGPEDPIARYRTVIISRLRLFGIGIPLLVGLIAGPRGAGRLADRAAVPALHGRSGSPTPSSASTSASTPSSCRSTGGCWTGCSSRSRSASSSRWSRTTCSAASGSRAAPGRCRPPRAPTWPCSPGVFVLLKAVAYYLDRYELLYSTRNPTFTGATYTDLNAVMPAKLILLFISIICAAAFFVGGVPAQPAAARDRGRAAGAVERAGRRGVARGAAAVRRRPERERARGPVDPAQHRRHPPGVRPDAGQGRHPALRRHVGGDARRGRDRHATRSRTSACSTRASSATRSRSSSSGGTSTGSPRTSTSTATRSTARRRTTSSPRASSTARAWSTTSRTGSTGTSSTPTATAWSSRRRTR